MSTRTEANDAGRAGRIHGPGTPGWTLPAGESWPSPVSRRDLGVATLVVVAAGILGFLSEILQRLSTLDHAGLPSTLITMPVLAGIVATLLTGRRRAPRWRGVMFVCVAAASFAAWVGGIIIYVVIGMNVHDFQWL